MEENVAKFRNISGQTLFVVAVGHDVEDDGVFNVPDDDAPGFECQPTNYVRVDESKAKAAEKESK